MVFTILIIASTLGLALYPKSIYRLNGVKSIILVPLTVCGYLAICGFIICLVLKRMSIWALALPLLMFTVLLWADIVRKKEIQKYFLRREDIIGLTVVIGFVLLLTLHMFGTDLSIQYSTAVGGSQYLDTMNLLRGTALQEVSFSTYIEAIFVGAVIPFRGEADAYKAFIAAEIFLRILEVGMLYVVVLTVSDRKLIRYAAPVIGICYFFGYPALSLFWANCDYWNAGALLLLWIVYSLLVLEKKKNLWHLACVYLGMTLLVDVVCAQYYAAFHMLGVVIALLFLWAVKKRDITKQRIKENTLVGICLFGAAAVLLFYFKFFVQLGDMVPSVSEQNAMYRCMYGDLLFFIPALFFVTAYVSNTKLRFGCITALSVWSVVGTIVLYVLWYQSRLDTYYYFVNYYNLWVLGWILAAAALEIMAETKQLPIFFSYVGMIAAIALLVLTNYDAHMWKHNPYYNGMYVTRNFFSLYRQCMDAVLTDYEEYRMDDEVLEAFKAAAEWDGLSENVIITEEDAERCWYDAFTGMESEKLRYEKLDFPDMIQKLAADSVKSVTVMKSEETYTRYGGYYEKCQTVYEDDEIAVYSYRGENWNDIFAMDSEYSDEKKELFSYVQENLDGETVPLMAHETAYMDFVVYENMTGTKGERYYTWYRYPGENIDNLNAYGIKYIVLLYGDEFYETTSEYFRRQEIVYENEAGMVVRCQGETWLKEYGE